jgi:hypothetical protein
MTTLWNDGMMNETSHHSRQSVNILPALINIVQALCRLKNVVVLIPPNRSIFCPRRIISFKIFAIEKCILIW